MAMVGALYLLSPIAGVCLNHIFLCENYDDDSYGNEDVRDFAQCWGIVSLMLSTVLYLFIYLFTLWRRR